MVIMTTPICRCRVLYLGSAVPHITKDGLQGIQEPLRDLYPEQGSFSAKGIDSWLSVWSNGILMENVDESMRQVTRFFNIETLHYCAAIRYVVVPGNNGERVEKFLPLDSPFARYADPSHPPLFACILRRTTGIKVLECHAFICKKEAAANALVRCCFHSYADSMQAKQLDENPYYMENRRSQSLSGLNTLEKVEVWRSKGEGSSTLNPSSSPPTKQMTNGIKPTPPPRNSVVSPDDDNYKVWTGIAPTERELLYVDASGTMRSLKSALGTLRSAQAKIRQMAGGIPRPPPPPSPSLFNGKDKSIKANKPSKSKSKKKMKEQQLLMNGSARVMNGVRPVSVMGHYGSIPPPPPPQGPYRNSGFYTERRIHKNGRLPLPGHEEPVYISSARPLSPVSTYQPAAFPYEQYFMQYGTAPRGMQFREGPHIRGRPSQQAQQHYYQPQTFHAPPHPPDKIAYAGDPDNHKDEDNKDDLPFDSVYSKRKGKKPYHGDCEDNNHKDDPDSPFNTGVYKRKGYKPYAGDPESDKDEDNKDDPDSPFNTGIYKRKGHLNERAFSYSIRQEHRSRSNSLASLQFFANNGDPIATSNGEGPERSRDEDRKERELAQLISGLDLKKNGVAGSTSSRRGESNFIKKKASNFQR